jgi:hypothetical protein
MMAGQDISALRKQVQAKCVTRAAAFHHFSGSIRHRAIPWRGQEITSGHIALEQAAQQGCFERCHMTFQREFKNSTNELHAIVKP